MEFPLFEIDDGEAAFIYGGVAAATLPMPKDANSFVSVAPAKNEPTEESKWSESVQTLLDQPAASLPARILVGGMAFTVAFTSWAWFSQIEEVGNAQGKLIPAGETYKVQPIDGGKAIKIAVKEGEEVKAGQVLVELDRELAQKEVERLQQSLLASQIELAQKESLLERINLETRTNKVILATDLLAQRAAINLAREKAATTTRLLSQLYLEVEAFKSRKANTQPISSLAKKRLKQLELEISANQKRLQRLMPLQQEGAVSQEFIFQAQQELLNVEKQLTQSQLQEVTGANEQLFQADQSLRELESRITQNKGELDSTRQEIQRLEAELAQKKAQGDNRQLEVEQKKRQLQIDVTQIKGKIDENKTLLVAAKTKLKNNLLKAPIDGVVLTLNLKNPGEVLQTGQTVAEIAPKDAPLILDAYLPNKEAGFVKKGMPVQIKLDAYPYQDYGIVSGKVISVSSDTKRDERLGEVYRVKVQLERNYVVDEKKKVNFKPGQTAAADIIIRRRRVMDVLLEPIKEIQKDGMKL